MSSTNPITLRFNSRELEGNFLKSSFERERSQGRAAIIVGSIVYLIYGILDQWFVPDAAKSTVWTIRLGFLIVPLLVYLISYTRTFAAYRHVFLASVGFAAGAGLISILTFLSVENSSYFYPGLVLVTFYTYNFVGTRFVHALCVDLSLFLAYNLVFGVFHDYPIHVLISHDFFILSANLIGGTAGYLNEKQQRLLFVRERELNEERNRHLIRSLHDPLTGLPNRELLHDRLEQAWLSAKRGNDSYCGYFIDLDGFKNVNDRLGHEMGDQVLMEIARRLNATVRESDTVARMGGDEFFFLARGIPTEKEATALAQKLITVISAPLKKLPPDLPLGASIGMCLFPSPGITGPSEVIRRADHAMYRAKENGKGISLMFSDQLLRVNN